MTSLMLRTIHQLSPVLGPVLVSRVARPVLCTMIRRRALSSDRTTFDEKELALEELFIRKASEKQQKILLKKILAQEREQAQLAARQELYRILTPHVHDLPESTIQSLLAWKDKFARFHLSENPTPEAL